jgi:hypothetical protein
MRLHPRQSFGGGRPFKERWKWRRFAVNPLDEVPDLEVTIWVLIGQTGFHDVEPLNFR